jgi:phosphoesterase RecJ-like protein
MIRDRSRVLALFRKGTRFCLTSHVNPDGDSLASLCALQLALAALGKRATVAGSDPVPRAYRFLAGTDRFREGAPRSWRGYDALIALDCGDAGRSRLLSGVRPPRPVVNIDHHATNPHFGDLNWVLPAASSTAELVYEVVVGLGVRPAGALAEALYTGILTDTGSFRHGNTTPRALEIASRLVAAGVDPSRVASAVYESVPYATLRALGAALTRLGRTPDGRVAWLSLPRRRLGALASPAETEEWVRYPRALDTALIALCFKEVAPRRVRVSFRGKAGVDVAALASRWGGGGHRSAAGATVLGGFSRVQREVVAAARSHLKAPRPTAIPGSPGTAGRR